MTDTNEINALVLQRLIYNHFSNTKLNLALVKVMNNYSERTFTVTVMWNVPEGLAEHEFDLAYYQCGGSAFDDTMKVLIAKLVVLK